MWPVIVDVVAAVVAGGLVTLLAWRWPHAPVAAPQVEPSTIRTEVRRHGRLARMLQARIDPQATTGLALTVAGAIVIIGGVGAGLLLFMVRRNLGFAKWDLSAARFGAQHATSASTAVYQAPSRGYNFDTDFLLPSLLPPGTPMFRDVNTLTFRQLLRPTQ